MRSDNSSNASKQVLVTGGTGFLGAQLVRMLSQRGNHVRVLDNGSRGQTQRLSPLLEQIELIEGDVRDPSVVARAVLGMDAVFHLACVNGTRRFYENPEHVLDVGLRGTLNVLEASIRASVADFFFASSSEVYQTPPHVPTPEDVPMQIPDPRNPRYSYAGAKLVGEILSFSYGRARFARTIAFRPHNIYGADMGFEHVIPELTLRLCDLARKQRFGPLHLPIQGDGTETRAFCHVSDFVEGLSRIEQHGEDQAVYNIGTNEEISIADLARAIGAALRREVVVEPSSRRAGSTPRRCPDTAKLEALGYAPRQLLATGLPEAVKWYAAWSERHFDSQARGTGT